MPNVGPGAGTIGGSGGNFVESITLDAQGRVTAAVANVPPSDKRLKTDIEDLDNSLEKLQEISGYTYRWKDKIDKSVQIGVIAQEIEKVFPDLVKVRSDGFKGVNYTGLIPILIEAIKEQQQLINDLQALLDDEKASKEDLKAALDKQHQLIELQSTAMLSLQNDNQTMRSDIDAIKLALGLRNTTVLTDQSEEK